MLLMLMACGEARGRLVVSHVDPALRSVFDRLLGELPDLVEEGPNGVIIVAGVPDLADSEEAVGLWQPGLNRITVVAEGTLVKRSSGSFFLSESTVELCLAHELGHAMGMRHSNLGIMAPRLGSNGCRDRASDCLRQAWSESNFSEHGELE
jgi:hypothetical protein